MAKVNISIDGDKRFVQTIDNFQKATPESLKRGFNLAGAIFVRDMKRKLSGPGRFAGSTHGPISRLGTFPGVRSGRLRGSVNAKVQMRAGSPELRVGPNVKYARFLEFGTSKMPEYPFVGPTLNDQIDKAMDVINREITKPLRRV